MTLQKKLQINIVMTNYYQRSGNYSSTYDYIFLDNLASSSYANLFRSDLKNLKIKTLNGSECQALYIPSYGTQGAAILARVPVSQISQTTKLLLDVHDTGTTFSSTLTTGSEVLMFDANSDTYSQFFMNYSGLSSNNDSTDGGKYLRARFVPSIDGSSPTGLYTTFASGQPLANNRVVALRFKRIGGNVVVNDNATYHGSTSGSIMMQSDFNLTMYQVDRKDTVLTWSDDVKSYCMFEGAKTLVQLSSWDAYASGSDDNGNYKQYHLHARAGTGTSNTSDYLEGFMRNNPTKIYQNVYNEVSISPEWFLTDEFDEYNYVDLKWLLIFPSPLFAANGIPQVSVTQRQTKIGIRLYKGEHEYPKAYKGSTLLWDANDESMENTGLYIPDKIINHDWDWVF
ncbi:hypothetical protein [uncultured Methanobrevibacter sp.]|uniref:hypothetical protein n=1 Tax=uncultured Methanobrevibacter sp. TaxID=253161 RepID=UPI001B13E172|nr:hypothetical protein [uncultured Methanobrevibacter sp.]MBO6110813.1 hypothetical protein [Methanobrevibacter sp.]